MPRTFWILTLPGPRSVSHMGGGGLGGGERAPLLQIPKITSAC